MSNMNVVILSGNVTRDPEINYAGQEADRANFGIASNRKWKGQDGEMKEEVCFVDLVAWKGTANIVAQYVKKGQRIGIVGELKLNQWNAQDGAKRSKLVVTVKQIELIGGDQSTAPGHHGHYEQAQAQPAQPTQQTIGPEELPF